MEIKLSKESLKLSKNICITYRSREEGEKDLIRLCRKARKEGVWIYYKDECEFWFNVPGKKIEINDGKRYLLGSETPGLDYNELTGKTHSHYHIHPRRAIKPSAKVVSQDNLKGDLIEVVENFIILPSYQDVSLYSKIYSESLDVKFCIVTERGATDISVNHKRVSLPSTYTKLCIELSRYGNIEDVIQSYNEMMDNEVSINFRKIKA